ncbi:MAG: hypothetical protein ABSH22_01965 [Tepidisphaeraceae bacterium]
MTDDVKCVRVLPFVLALCFSHSLFCAPPCRADNFGDVWIVADAIYTGNTFHGYSETRLTLENRSAGRTHSVTLNLPADDFDSFGNSIGRLSRTVTLAPQAHQVMGLLQPPLPTGGSGLISVEVDGRVQGNLRAPNANSHCQADYSSRIPTTTVFISRSLDYDAVCRIFNAGRGPFSAAMATGAPDATSSGTRDPNTWRPDERMFRRPNWLELDYATPQIINQISVYASESLPAAGSIVLTTDTGAPSLRIPMSSGASSSNGTENVTQFSLPATAATVRTVRLDFGTTPAYEIGIDAVGISGPTGSQWASDARASSTLSAAYVAGATGDSVEGMRSEMPTSELSTDWLAYTPFDVVVLGHGDLASLPPEASAALWNYAQAGGNLVVFGSDGVPQEWRTGPQASLQDGIAYDAGLGHFFVFKSEDPSTLDSYSMQRLRTAVNDELQYWQSLPTDMGGANSALPLVDDLKIPTRGLVFVMLVFIILIGPVNLIVLSRRKRRTWMLWTIPAISLLTTLIVFAYSLFSEGITPTIGIAGLTVLDQGAHHAATIGGEGYYCPLTPSGGLHFDSDTEATPLVNANDRSGSGREVDWTQAQDYTRGWVSARVPAFFHLRKSQTRRERLQVENKDGRLQIVNGLGAPIKSLWFADAHMNIYAAQDIPAGQTAALEALNSSPVTEGTGGPQRLLRDISFAAHIDGLDQHAAGYLAPNTYLAVLDGNPFLENALGAAASVKRARVSAVVYGILESAGSL